MIRRYYRRRYLAATALFSALLAAPYALTLAATDLRSSLEERPQNIAHRGASARAPENTMEAFQLAREAGAGVLEMDLQMTRDERIVVMHDSTVERTTNGSGAVRHASFEKLRGLDAGYSFTPGGIPDQGPPPSGERVYRDSGVRVPEFSEVLAEFPEMRLNVEIKAESPGIERAVLQEILRAGAEERVLVASHEHSVIRRFREVSEGEIETAASVREVVRFYALSVLRLEGLVKPPYDALQIPVQRRGLTLASPRMIEAAHSRGVRVDVWTIDEPREMRRLLGRGTDAIITNRPAELRVVLEKRDG